MRILLLALFLVPGVAAFDSGDIGPGESWSMTFTEENVDGHHYHCHPHPWMVGMVHVGADRDGEVVTHHVDIEEGASSDDWGYSTEHLFIEVGDTVAWTNQGAAIHTVTKDSGEGSHDHGDHGDHDEHDHEHGEDASALGIGLGMLALLGVALRRR